MERPSQAPNVDVELIPLPFLHFAAGTLHTANAGARVLLGLLDSNLSEYTFDSLFPPSAGGSPETNTPKNEGHLQYLKAKVQSSQELLKLKAAVYTSETDGSLKSILIVDVSILASPTAQNVSNGSNAQSGAAAPYEPASLQDHHLAYQTIPQAIKRHSGDIRKIFGHERRKSQLGSSQLQQQPRQPQQQPQSSHSPSHDRSQAPETAPSLSSPLTKHSSSIFQEQKESPPVSPSMPSIASRGSDSTHSSTSLRSKSSLRSSLRLPTEGTEVTAQLAQSALAAHPKTGVIICRNDLSSGFVNSRTRELLMGMKSPEHEASDPFDDQFLSPASARQSHLSREQEDFSPAWEDEDFFEEGKVKINRPDKGTNLETSIADILRWSLLRRRARQNHRSMRDDLSVRSGRSFSPAASISGSSTMYTESFTTGASAIRSQNDMYNAMESKDVLRPWLAHKPYRCYDPLFSQRVEDPFESLFDSCVRKGEKASEVSIMVGVETEVGPIETCRFPDSECFTSFSESKDPNTPMDLVAVRVRRRIVNARAVPLRDVEGNHIGGAVWLIDFTGEALPASIPYPSVSQSIQNAHSAMQPPGFQAPSRFQGAGPDSFWQQMVNSLPQMVWVTNPEGEHIYFNNKW